MTKRLSNKVALVTGGSRGIGAAIARQLADDGADVVLSYVNSADKAKALVRELQDKGVRAAAFRADQASAVEVRGLVEQTLEAFGRLDILVNSAGVFVTGTPGDPANDEAALERQYAINVGGVVAAVHAAAPHLPPGGRIINIGSTLGTRTPFAGLADYSAGKAAVAAYTRGWARDLGSKGITVNTVQPGPIDTDMNPADGDFADTARAAVALGRYGKPEEIAAVVAFLAGPDASYVTGASIDVDGGFNA
ncbi:MAG TPA: SDR family oxidoreductase [Burkholderiales bacterium]|nr:SDR family oxidoreductase [Burkholderiales bacterium]